MLTKFRCPTCHELFSTPAEMAGAEMTCPMCQTAFEIPRPVRRSAKQTRGPRASPSADGNNEIVPATDEEDALLSPVTVRSRPPTHEDEIDMTPMVDVTFLLLIFFMVTAAFSLQKSLELPVAESSQPSTQAMSLDEIEADPQYVIVRIDEYNTFRVAAAAWEHEQEAASKLDLLDKLRAAQNSGPAPLAHMLVMASEEATHEQVVAALDAGSAVGMEDVRLLTMPVEK
jgi:biopolymer transport protein ExbD